MTFKLHEPRRVGGTSVLVAGLAFLFLSAPAHAQISLVHATSCGFTSAFPATKCTIPATGNGNLLVVGFTSTGGTGSAVVASVTDNSGNTYLEAGPARAVDTNPSSNDMADVWYAKNSLSGATTVTITPNPSGTVGTAVIWEFAGVDTTAPLDQTAVLNSQPATTTTSAPAVTAAVGELVVSMANVQNSVTGVAAGNPFVSDSTASSNGWAHAVASSAGAYGARWNSTSGTYCAVTTSFKAKAGGGSSSNTGGACDLNNDGVVNVVDVQLAINMDLGLLVCTADIDGLAICNPTVVQRIVSAALGSSCVVTNPHSVTLNWTGSASSNITGYNVYRGTTSGGPYTKVNGALIGTTSYLDGTVLAGQNYYYVATAVDSSNIESGYSTEAIAQVPSP